MYIKNILERWATGFWARYFLKLMKWSFALKTAGVEAVGRYDLPKVETLMWKANNYQAKMRTPRSCEYPPNLHPISVMLISHVIRENLQTVRTLIASHKKRIHQNSLFSLFHSFHNLYFFSFCYGVCMCALTRSCVCECLVLLLPLHNLNYLNPIVKKYSATSKWSHNEDLLFRLVSCGNIQSFSRAVRQKENGGECKSAA